MISFRVLRRLKSAANRRKNAARRPAHVHGAHVFAGETLFKRPLNRRIPARQWRNALLWAVVLMALTTLPYLACALAQNSDWTFGGSIIGVTDGNSYLAKMRQGARSDWLFHIVYTSEPHEGALLFLPYILLGKLAARFADPGTPGIVDAMVVVFHAARVVFGVLAVLMTFRFAAAYLKSGAARLAATVIITAGGGLGWLLMALGQGAESPDFYVPEGYTFLILYALPHMALSRALLLAGLMWVFPVRGQSLRNALLAGGCWLGMGLCVPFYMAVLYVILGVWGLGAWARARRFPWGLFWRAVTGALVTLPLFLYTAYHFVTNEVFAVWSSQNTLPSPSPVYYVFGYGVLIVPAVWGARWAWRRGRVQDVLLVAWGVAAPVMVYLPINVQRRLAEGVFVPLGILAAAGLRGWAAPWLTRTLSRIRSHRGAWKLAYSATLVLVLPTSLLLLGLGFVTAVLRERPAFHPAEEIAAMDWLADHAPRGAVVLGAFETGNYLPARADVRAFLGLGPETVHSDEKRGLVRRFFYEYEHEYEHASVGADEASAFYETYGIDYVYHGPLEGAERHPDPPWAKGLTPVYDAAGYTIYKVP